MDRAARLGLFLMSIWFYGYLNPSYIPVILVSIGVNFLISKNFDSPKKSQTETKDQRGTSKNRILLALGLGFNLGLLFYFKYYDFFISNINTVFKTDFNLLHIALPLGISFFTFQQVSFCIDSYRGEIGEYSLLDYCVFVAFFPQLVAGPIVLHEEILPQLKEESNHRLNPKNISIGLHAFALGLAKKVIIADTLGVPVTLAFGGVEVLTSSDVLLTTLCYCLQLYFDFSGYCDMAYGIAMMFNIEIPANFNSPYKADSIPEFWKRWHITLTRFLRKYVYFPLGGNRRGPIRTYINIFIVFLLSGIWHGANWTFILWGVMHGFAQMIGRLIDKPWKKVPKPIRWAITFSFVAVAFLIFRADSVAQAYIMLRKVVKLENFSVTPLLLTGLMLPEVKHLFDLFGMASVLDSLTWLCPALFLLVVMGITLFTKNTREKEFKPDMAHLLSTVVLIVWSVLSLSGISTFLYFNF